MDKVLHLSVHDIVDFLLRTGDIDNRIFNQSSMKEGTLLHALYQSKQDDSYLSEYYLKDEFLVDGVKIFVEGRADGIIVDGDSYTIDEIKTTIIDLTEYKNENLEWHLGQAKFYAYMFAKEKGLDTIKIKLTYIKQGNTREKLHQNYKFNFLELEQFVYSLLQEYVSFYAIIFRHIEQRNKSIDELSFPYLDYRSGQKILIDETFSTGKKGGKLYCEAPTGIGKTISTLFPYIKLLNDDNESKIFYLTAKNSGKLSASHAVNHLIDAGLKGKSIVITSKEKICFQEHRNCNPDECPYAKAYYSKIQGILRYALMNYDFIGAEEIIEIAKDNYICPFELELDLSLFMDVIICDYNYLFDPISYMQRFFDKDAKMHMVLIDEAHNLVDRSRDMYSASLDIYKVKTAAKVLKGKDARKLVTIINKIKNYMLDQAAINMDQYRVIQGFSRDFIALANKFLTTYKEFSKDKDFKMPEEVVDLFLDINKFVIIDEYYSDEYLSYIDAVDEDVAFTYYCMDASSYVASRLDSVKSSVLFSATLSPMDYFVNCLGGNTETDTSLKLSSPFPRDNFKLLVAPKASLMYKNRESSYPLVVEYIKSYVSSKVGNYFIYVPSYEYLYKLKETLSLDNVDIFYQEKDMNDFAKEEFISHFKEAPTSTCIGAAVLGGAFSEGIDLISDRLIGVVIVGVGLPKINFNSDNIKEYFDREGLSGFEYAYTNPGINKITQAIGRVIRSENDVGSALLIDERFLRRPYRKLIEEKYKNYSIVMSGKDIKEELDKFFISIK